MMNGSSNTKRHAHTPNGMTTLALSAEITGREYITGTISIKGEIIQGEILMIGVEYLIIAILSDG